VLTVLYAAVVIPVGINKGADLEIHLEQARLLLSHQAVYTTQPPFGVWWPPLGLLVAAPFALIANGSMALAKASFAIASVACLAYAIARTRSDAATRAAVLLALAAVAVPLQTNFEYQNLNAPLLALLVASGAALRGGHETRAAVGIGVMSALKGFPALLLVYFVYRGRWRGLAIAVATAVALTLGAVLPAGPIDGAAVLDRWIGMGLTGVADMRGRSQSLPALLFRVGTPPAWAAALELVVLAGIVWVLRRRQDDPAAELAVLMLLAVFLSPVAHTHYYLLAYPAWLVVLTRRAPVPSRAIWCAGLAVAGVLTSGFLTLGSYEWRRSLLATAPYAWGAVLLLLLLLIPVSAAAPAESRHRGETSRP
jgi:hypothetical protein